MPRRLAAAALAVAALAALAAHERRRLRQGLRGVVAGPATGAAVVPKTMQLPLLLELVNDGRSACTLEGYPRIALLSASGTVFPFAYRDGGDEEVTSRRPATVTLRPGGAAFVLLNKNACIANVNGRLARQVRVQLRRAPPRRLRSRDLRGSSPTTAPRATLVTASTFRPSRRAPQARSTARRSAPPGCSS